MAKQHSATPEFSTILELRDRVEALEARNEDDKEAWAAMRRANISAALHIDALMRRIDALEAAQHAKPNHPAKPDGLLVKRVKGAINRNRNDVSYGTECAKASILEVAAWLRDHYGGTTASTDLLEQEAER